jgi:predicted RNA-binding Zn ribbon-like protein
VDPAPGEDRSLAVALVNSLHSSRFGMVDEIAAVDGLRTWLHGRTGASSVAPNPEDVARAQSLRAAIRETLTAVLEHRAPAGAALRTLSDTAAGAPGAPELEWEDGAPAARWREVAGSDVDRALAAIARDAMAVVTDARAAALGRCEAPGCVRLLLRDHNRRRWCSTGCGDRVRSARYHGRRM